MTPKGFFKSLGKALLYFAVYFGWQMIVMNWLSLGASYYYMLSMDLTPELIADSAKYNALMLEVTEKVYDLVMRYALHLTLIAGALTVVTFTVIFRMRKKRLASEVGLNRQPIMRILLLVLLGIALNITVSGLLSIIPFPESWVESYAESTEIFTEANLIINLLTTLICAPLVEELTFRGLMYTRLSKGMPTFAALLISSWVFGVVHGTMIQFLYAALLGMLLCWIRVRYDSLTASIAVHFGFNSFSLIAAAIPEDSGALFLTLMIVSVIVSAAILYYVARTSKGRVSFTLEEKEN